jgi:uncharacterized surface protein with fasciclin (FAS1) repeats
LDVSIVAGHRYTVVAMGQLSDSSHTALVIDETAAFQAIGASPTDSVQVTVNNLTGVPALDEALNGRTRARNVPYGGFKAAIWPVGFFGGSATVSGAPDKVLVKEADYTHFHGPGLELFACWGGSYPGRIGADYDNHLAPRTSALNTVEYLQLLTDTSAKNGGKSASFATLLAAVKTAGLTDMLINGGPYLVLAPRDEAFAALPKDKLNALLADPKALTDLLHGHIAEGYYPAGVLSSAPGVPGFDRTVTNMRGEQLTFQGGGDPLMINGTIAGFTEVLFVANGTRVMPIGKVLLPDAK